MEPGVSMCVLACFGQAKDAWSKHEYEEILNKPQFEALQRVFLFGLADLNVK
jgi:hypothetical protein